MSTFFYYVYRLTCQHSDSPEKYYYGVRKSRLHPSLDTRYWSSSRYIAAARKYFEDEWFTKKIVSHYVTALEVYAKEIRLHQSFDVKTDPWLFNRAKQTTSKFSRAGIRCSLEIIEKIRQANQQIA
jgi:predicted RNA-binding protein